MATCSAALSAAGVLALVAAVCMRAMVARLTSCSPLQLAWNF
jgi:hypothetical protein